MTGLVVCGLQSTAWAVPAFPGAEGFGAKAIGGRGGRVVQVTNLNDSGPGSLREALMMTEPRIIVFRVSGTIFLESKITLGKAQSYVTVAGQTAPGEGITVANGMLRFRDRDAYPNGFHDGIFRFLRWRHGVPIETEVETSSSDNASIEKGSYNIIFDHNSFTWGGDEVVSVWGPEIRNITWSWNIFAEGKVLCRKRASDGSVLVQNVGPYFGGGSLQYNISFHHNYLAHMCFRNPLLSSGHYILTNNVSYNTSKYGVQISQNHYVNSKHQIRTDLVGNYFKQGPDSSGHLPIEIIRDEEGTYQSNRVYLSGNYAVDGNGNPIPEYDPNDQTSLITARSIGAAGDPTYTTPSTPQSVQPDIAVTVHSAQEAYKLVREGAGATLPVRDSIDSRIVTDAETGGAWSETNVAKYLTPVDYTLPTDSDSDGMPDSWEVEHNLDPKNAADSSGDRDGDGYTNIEEYINSIVGAPAGESPPVPPSLQIN